MKTKICISIDKDLLEQIKKEAKKENRTISNYINNKLKDVK